MTIKITVQDTHGIGLPGFTAVLPDDNGTLQQELIGDNGTISFDADPNLSNQTRVYLAGPVPGSGDNAEANYSHLFTINPKLDNEIILQVPTCRDAKLSPEQPMPLTREKSLIAEDLAALRVSEDAPPAIAANPKKYLMTCVSVRIYVAENVEDKNGYVVYLHRVGLKEHLTAPRHVFPGKDTHFQVPSAHGTYYCYVSRPAPNSTSDNPILWVPLKPIRIKLYDGRTTPQNASVSITATKAAEKKLVFKEGRTRLPVRVESYYGAGAVYSDAPHEYHYQQQPNIGAASNARLLWEACEIAARDYALSQDPNAKFPRLAYIEEEVPNNDYEPARFTLAVSGSFDWDAKEWTEGMPPGAEIRRNMHIGDLIVHWVSEEY